MSTNDVTRAAVVQHKCMHRYVVRAKQGGAQSTHDKQSGHKAKSAGAYIRRRNEVTPNLPVPTCHRRSSSCSRTSNRCCSCGSTISTAATCACFAVRR